MAGSKSSLFSSKSSRTMVWSSEAKDSTLWNEIRKPFLSALSVTVILLQLLFLCNLCYLYGTQLHNSTRAHNLKILYVDYDGGDVGRSVVAAYNELKGKDFPTLVQHQASDYPSADKVYEAVCHRHYWGAIYSNPDASKRLSNALYDETAASQYNNSDALTYVWNGIRYPAFSLSFIYSKIETLIPVARLAYNAMNGTAAAASIDWSHQASAEVLFDPISATGINIKPTEQGGRVLYNTVSMVMPIIQQFFMLMALNGISTGMQLYSRLHPQRNGIIRLILSAVYTLLGSLCMTGYIWAFREDWSVDAGQFFLTWIVCWLYMHINFLILDIATTWIPMQFMSFFVLTLALTSVSSTISPLELSPGFYHWGYALPAYETYQVLVQVWSGCDNQLFRALPILFSWWLVCLIAAILSLHYRCKAAIKENGIETDTDSQVEERK